jgi:hypothetical protein
MKISAAVVSALSVASAAAFVPQLVTVSRVSDGKALEGEDFIL